MKSGYITEVNYRVHFMGLNDVGSGGQALFVSTFKPVIQPVNKTYIHVICNIAGKIQDMTSSGIQFFGMKIEEVRASRTINEYIPGCTTDLDFQTSKGKIIKYRCPNSNQDRKFIFYLHQYSPNLIARHAMIESLG